MKSYTRQMIKTVKLKKEIQKPKKKPNNIIAKTPAPKPKLKSQEIKIKNISWELSADIAKNPKIKEYFLEIGQMLKTSLSKDLYISKTNVKNFKINIYTELNLNGNILLSKISESSGYEKIDNICLDTLYKIVKTNKLPKITTNKDKIKIKLLVKT